MGYLSQRHRESWYMWLETAVLRRGGYSPDGQQMRVLSLLSTCQMLHTALRKQGHRMVTASLVEHKVARAMQAQQNTLLRLLAKKDVEIHKLRARDLAETVHKEVSAAPAEVERLRAERDLWREKYYDKGSDVTQARYMRADDTARGADRVFTLWEKEVEIARLCKRLSMKQRDADGWRETWAATQRTGDVLKERITHLESTVKHYKIRRDSWKRKYHKQHAVLAQFARRAADMDLGLCGYGIPRKVCILLHDLATVRVQHEKSSG